ncbi:hypothetical protein QZJ86_04215 [Methylomonas montana]|uniref:hypothetical protein n=1 Tax=Methylomonas montana TaxID=3058963 RepID=UPI00265894F6|nr:hypothetical protein [Methylomonas montana]WKJ91340.1 hypothetical protein QZJ86_04215 [Methylomonas montana]
MSIRIPKGEDIAELLLLCAPQSILNDLELTAETRSDFVDRFDMSFEPNCIVNRYKTDLIALALYYSNINITNHKKYSDYVMIEVLDTFYIAPEVIYSLIQLTKSEEFYEVNKLKDEIDAGGLRKRDEIIKLAQEKLKPYKKGPEVKSLNTKQKYVAVKEELQNYLQENPGAPIEEARRIAAKRAGFKKIPTDKTLRDNLKDK